MELICGDEMRRKPKQGLYENIHNKRRRIKAGSGEKMKRKGQAGRPTAMNFRQAAKTAKNRGI